jgi:hypothetical protein
VSDERDLLTEAVDLIHEVAAEHSTLPMDEFRRTGAYKCMVSLVTKLRVRDAAARDIENAHYEAKDDLIAQLRAELSALRAAQPLTAETKMAEMAEQLNALSGGYNAWTAESLTKVLRAMNENDSAPPVAPSVPKCPTNHRHWTEQNPPHDEMKWDWKATHGYNFCPDCGAPLSEQNENQDVAAPSVGELEHVLRVEMGEFTRYHLTCNLDDSAACHQVCATHMEGGCADKHLDPEIDQAPCVQEVYRNGCVIAEWVNDGGIESVGFDHTVELPVTYYWDGAHDFPILSVLQRILSGAAE